MSVLETLKETFHQICKDKEVLELTKLQHLFMEAKNQRLPNKERMECLLNSLLTATAYEERLTRIKIQSKGIASRLTILREKKKNRIIDDDPKFYTRRKGDQDKIIASNMESLVIFLQEVKDFVETVNDALDYIRSAEFAMKSSISIIKEYLND